MEKQNKKSEIEFFDNFVEDSDYDVLDEHGYRRIIDEFFRFIEPKDQLKIIDMGCGTGAFIAKFLDHGFELYGIDISSKSIDLARRKYPTITFEVGDIENTNWADSSFDIILLSGVLHHFPDFTLVVKECYRILKKGGGLLAYDPHRQNPIMWMYRCKDSPFYSSKGVTENEAPLSKNRIIESFSLYNFSQLQVYSISGITYKYVESRSAKLLLPAYNFIERVFDIPFLRNRYGSFVITYARK